MTKPSPEHAARIPCLDGLRAISIGFVLLSHLDGTRGCPNLHLSKIGDLGNFGVRVFFVISGYLITRLLLAEFSKTKRISIPMFYFRRTFRIFPAFYGVIALFTVFHFLGWMELKDGDVLHSMTFTMNYHPERAWQVGHLWSLSVEEQFYLAWPALVLLLRPKGAFFVACAAVLLAPAIRAATWVLLPGQREGIGETFQTVADSLATGCVLAMAGARLGRMQWFTKIQTRGITPIALFLFALLAHHFHDRISFGYTVGETLTNVSVGLVVDAVLRNPTSLFGRFLELRPLVFIGTLSYSLYLVQQPFLDHASTRWWTAFPANIALVFVAALASYYLVEKPFLDLRQRLQKRMKKPAPAAREEPAPVAGTTNDVAS